MFFLLILSGCARVPKIIVLEDPLTASEHVDLGVAYERNGELDLAQREYEQALRKEKSHFQARFNLGNVFLAKKDFGRAREEYLLALDIRPGDAEAANNLSWCAILSGDGMENALARMEAAVSGAAVRRPEFLDTLGVLLMRLDRPGAAADSFEEAWKLCGVGCPGSVRRDIEEHRSELQRRFPSTSPRPALIE